MNINGLSTESPEYRRTAPGPSGVPAELSGDTYSIPETSSYSLTDRALWDLPPPGAKLISPHPAAGKPWAERDWNRREALCSKDDASEVASEVDRLAKNILETLGYKALSQNR